MLHDPYPVADLLGQIAGSNAGSKSWVKIVGQIHGSNCWVKSVRQIASLIHGSNSLVELLGQIAGSNLWVKLGGHVTSGVTSVTCDVTSNAANPWPAAGQPRRMHGRAYGLAENGQGRTGNGQRKSRAECARLGLDWFSVI